jgi:hypothetical protein
MVNKSDMPKIQSTHEAAVQDSILHWQTICCRIEFPVRNLKLRYLHSILRIEQAELKLFSATGMRDCGGDEETTST